LGRDLRQDGAWGGQVAAEAFALEFKCRLYIFSFTENGGPDNIITITSFPCMTISAADVTDADFPHTYELFLLGPHYWLMHKVPDGAGAPPQAQLLQLQEQRQPQPQQLQPQVQEQRQPQPQQLQPQPQLGEQHQGRPNDGGRGEGGRAGGGAPGPQVKKPRASSYQGRVRPDPFATNPRQSAKVRLDTKARAQGQMGGALARVGTADEERLFEYLYRVLSPQYKGNQFWQMMNEEWRSRVEEAALTRSLVNIRPKNITLLQEYAKRVSKEHEATASSVSLLSGGHSRRDPEHLRLRQSLMVPFSPAAPLLPPPLAIAPSAALIDPRLLPAPVPRLASVDPVELQRLLQGGAKPRGAYNCARCGQPKKGHTCSVPPP
jgi:hypothetical protein